VGGGREGTGKNLDKKIGKDLTKWAWTSPFGEKGVYQKGALAGGESLPWGGRGGVGCRKSTSF